MAARLSFRFRAGWTKEMLSWFNLKAVSQPNLIKKAVKACLVGLNFTISRFVKQLFFEWDFQVQIRILMEKRSAPCRDFFLLLGHSFGAWFCLSLSQYFFIEVHVVEHVRTLGIRKNGLNVSVFCKASLFSRRESKGRVLKLKGRQIKCLFQFAGLSLFRLKRRGREVRSLADKGKTQTILCLWQGCKSTFASL